MEEAWPVIVADDGGVEVGARHGAGAAGTRRSAAARIDLTLHLDTLRGTAVRIEELPVSGRAVGSALREQALSWRLRECLVRLALLAELPAAPGGA